MGMYLNPGNKMFQRALDARFYVDKTRLVSFLNERMGTDEALVCVSRPRRFGKSVDADMLVAYYSRGCDSSSQFEGLDASHDARYEEHLNAHNVIKIDVQQMASRGEGGLKLLPQTIAAEIVPELRESWPHVVPESLRDLPKALAFVEAAAGCGFVFVIDEWDCLFRLAAGDIGAQSAYLDFLRDLLKGRSYVDACYMTGILPVKKYGAHSALNMFTEYSMTDPKTLEALMGFNEAEVERLCAVHGADFAELSRWYDGYLLGLSRIHVYNPRSVAGAIAERQCTSFWTNTETYEALQVYIDMDFDGIVEDLVAMLGGQRVLAEVSGFDNSMTNITSKDDVYALLVHLGYLTYDQAAGAVLIPNEEVRREFLVSLRKGRRPQLAELVRNSVELVARTQEGDCAYVADAVARAHASAAGPAHYNDEQALRAAVKLAYVAAVDEYLRIDELPAGRGYADLVFVPKPGSSNLPMVVELKWDKPVEAAIVQIKRRDYPAALAGLFGTCLLVGISYRVGTGVHECTIERVELPKR